MAVDHLWCDTSLEKPIPISILVMLTNNSKEQYVIYIKCFTIPQVEMRCLKPDTPILDWAGPSRPVQGTIETEIQTKLTYM